MVSHDIRQCDQPGQQDPASAPQRCVFCGTAEEYKQSVAAEKNFWEVTRHEYDLLEMLSYPFHRPGPGGRAMLVSLCAALLGVSLVLKRYSMIGDGLSHVSFGALSVAVAFGLGPPAGIHPGGGGWPRFCCFGSRATGRSRATRPSP